MANSFKRDYLFCDAAPFARWPFHVYPAVILDVLMRERPLSRTYDVAGARGILRGNGQSGREGLVALLMLIVACDPFVMGVDPMAAVCCFHFVRCHCVVPLVLLQMEKVLGE